MATPTETEEEKIESVYSDYWALIKSHDWKGIDAKMSAVVMDNERPSVLLSILTITAMSEVRKRLKCRNGFYDRVSEHLAAKHGREKASAMLIGLDCKSEWQASVSETSGDTGQLAPVEGK